jgi:hypothetical protein
LDEERRPVIVVNFLEVWGTPQTFQTRIRKDGKIAVLN